MAKIYYVKDGPRPDNSGLGYPKPLADLEKKLLNIKNEYLGETPPEFNKEAPSPFPRTVVIEIDAHESKGKLFTKTGFYLLPQLTPDEAEAIIFSK